MTTQATLGGETSAREPALYMALELSDRTWKVLFAAPSGRRRERAVGARDLAGLMREIAEAKRKLGLPADARVVSCYEAGRAGFWLHRALQAASVESLVAKNNSCNAKSLHSLVPQYPRASPISGKEHKLRINRTPPLTPRPRVQAHESGIATPRASAI